MKSKLATYEAYGEKKHDYKLSTEEKRRALRQEGTSYEELLKINDYKDKIFSFNTMKTYQNEVSHYATWLESKGMKKCSWEEAKEQIQTYINEIAMTKSAWSVHTSLAALCKTFEVGMWEYKHPKRKLCNIKRGVHECVHDKRNEKNCKDIIEANRVLGLRRNELKHLKVSDVSEYEKDGRKIIKISYKGKGGKSCNNYYIDEHSQNFIRNLVAGRKPDELVFIHCMEQFKWDLDIHSYRAEAARNMYQYILEHEEEKGLFKELIEEEFQKRGKRLPKKLDGTYKLKGDNKRKHEEMGMETEVDRFAALAVSCLMLNHYRVSVSVNHYLLHL